MSGGCRSRQQCESSDCVQVQIRAELYVVGSSRLLAQRAVGGDDIGVIVVRALTMAVMRVVRLHSESSRVFARGGTHEDVTVKSCSYVEGGRKWWAM